MTALVSLWTEVRRRLEAAGVDSPVIDARLLLEAGAGVSRLDIITDPRRDLTETQIAAVEALTLRREQREPIGHIIGRKAFWTLDLDVGAAVLSPRPETELLVETALAVLPKDAPARVLDLGVGSGAIVLAILAERPNAKAVGVDFSEAALAVAQRNADKLGLASRLELRSGDWSAGLEETFDLVVSNPPYIPTGEIADLEPEVSKYEPRLALDGGADGLAAYRSIIAALPTLLVPGGVFALEVGRGQDFAVAALAAEAGLSPEQSKMDLNGIARVVWGRRSS